MVHDAEMVKRHPYGPVAAAILDAARALNEDAAGAGFRVATGDEGADRRAVALEKRIGGFPGGRAGAPAENKATEEKLGKRDAGPGRGESRAGLLLRGGGGGFRAGVHGR